MYNDNFIINHVLWNNNMVDLETELKVTELFFKIFQKAPDSEIKDWKYTILKEIKSLKWIINSSEISQETKSLWKRLQTELEITELYHRMLHRAPDYAGMLSWMKKILEDGVSLEWIGENIQNSIEAKNLKQETV